MKTLFKILAVAAFFYALTLTPKQKEGIARESDSLWHYYNLSIEEIESMKADREFERKKPKTKQ